VPLEKFEALGAAATDPIFSELERRVIRYAEEVTRAAQVDAALVETLRRDLGASALVQLTLSIAAANFTNRFNEALGTDLEARSMVNRLKSSDGARADRREKVPGRIAGGRVRLHDLAARRLSSQPWRDS
jgi:post-segregation antitoxin (ccd killing protein)